MKTCTKCGQDKPATAEFFRKERRAHGLSLRAQCRECDKQYQREHPEKARAAVDRYNAKVPGMMKARNAAKAALREGRLVRQPCEICGAKGVMHHDNYDRPLDVRWLCRDHHAEWHSDMQMRLHDAIHRAEKAEAEVERLKWMLEYAGKNLTLDVKYLATRWEEEQHE